MNQARLARVLRNMERDGLTQIVISSTASVYYLTGYWVEPMERMLALYIRADGTCRLFANTLFALEPQEGLELVLHQESERAAYVEGLYRQHGADRSGEGQLVCFGPNGADPHHAPNGTVLRDGDSVVLDIFIPIRRYWCDMTRTVFFRSVSDEGRRVYETVKAANLAAEAVIRPGVPMKDIDRAARKLIEDAGYGPFFTHRLGHGCGLDCHEPPDTSASSPAVAEPGMVFSVEPGIYLPGKLGVRIEDLVLVTEDGCEVLNHASKELRVVD